MSTLGQMVRERKSRTIMPLPATGKTHIHRICAEARGFRRSGGFPRHSPETLRRALSGPAAGPAFLSRKSLAAAVLFLTQHHECEISSRRKLHRP